MRPKRRLAMISLAVALVVAGFLVFVQFRHEKLYKVTVLPSLGGRITRPCAINDHGQIAGLAEAVGGGYHLFLWNREKGMQDLGPTSESALDINNAGQIAGTMEDPNGNVRAFLWDPKDGKQMLGTLGGPDSIAWALNNRGQVVGASSPAMGVPRAFIWDKTSGMRDIGPHGGRGSGAVAINDAGQVLGFLEADTISRQPKPCFWDLAHGTNTSGIPLPSSDDYPGGSDINNSGYVVGRKYHWDKDEYYVYIWRKDAGLEWLFPLEHSAGPLVLNDANQVLYSEKYYSWFEWLSKRFFSPYTRRYLWDPKRGRILLDGHVPRRMGELTMVQDLNNKGCIVGVIRSKVMAYHLTVLLEPIPDRWNK